jgi:hypothetical protein
MMNFTGRKALLVQREEYRLALASASPTKKVMPPDACPETRANSGTPVRLLENPHPDYIRSSRSHYRKIPAASLTSRCWETSLADRPPFAQPDLAGAV